MQHHGMHAPTSKAIFPPHPLGSHFGRAFSPHQNICGSDGTCETLAVCFIMRTWLSSHLKSPTRFFDLMESSRGAVCVCVGGGLLGQKRGAGLPLHNYV